LIAKVIGMRFNLARHVINSSQELIVTIILSYSLQFKGFGLSMCYF